MKRTSTILYSLIFLTFLSGSYQSAADSTRVYGTITDKETWTKANKMTYSSHEDRKWGRYNEDFPLRGFILCDSCGKSLTGSYSRGNGGKYPYYHCAHKGCFKPTRMAKNTLEEQFIQYLNQFKLSEIQRKLLKEVINKKLKKVASQTKNEIGNLEKELDDIKIEKRKIIVSNDKGITNAKEAKDLVNDLRTREAVIKLELAEYKIDRKEGEIVIDFIKHFTKNTGKFWEELPLSKKRRLQSKIFPQGCFYNEGNFGTKEIALSFQLIKSFSDTPKPLVTPAGFEPAIFRMKT